MSKTRNLILNLSTTGIPYQKTNIFRKKELHVVDRFNTKNNLSLHLNKWLERISFGSTHFEFIFLGNSINEKIEILEKITKRINIKKVKKSFVHISEKKYNKVVDSNFFFELVNDEFHLDMNNQYHPLLENARALKLINLK